MALHASDFGERFIWGVSSSACQTEGAAMEGGKGPSIWDAFASRPGKVHAGHTTSHACNFYHCYIQDTILMQYLNISNFRFSIAWPRVLPEGAGKPNEKGLDFYERLVDFMLESEIDPWVTLYHWDLPLALEQKGGWTNRDIIHWFADYVELCVNRFSDRVKHWMVLNEPMAFTGAGYFLGVHAPGKKGLSNFLAAAHHAALCQSLGARKIKDHGSRLEVGTTFSCSYIDPVDQSRLNVEAARRIDALLNRLFIEPLLGLGYPVQDLRVLQQIEKYMRPGDEQILPFDMDFIGLQHYTREVVQYSPVMPYLHAKIVKAAKRNVPLTAMDWEIYPEGMYHLLKKFNAYPGIKKIIITENGAAFKDQVAGGKVDDPYRIAFLEQYLSQVLKAKGEGVKVDGYFAWSLLDNFEWAEGYEPRFGLVYVDYASQKRTIKSSGFWYQNFLSNSTRQMH